MARTQRWIVPLALVAAAAIVWRFAAPTGGPDDEKRLAETASSRATVASLAESSESRTSAPSSAPTSAPAVAAAALDAPRVGVIVGRVRDSHGDPVAAARVAVAQLLDVEEDLVLGERGPLSVLAASTTGADGRFRFEGLPLERVRVWAGRPCSPYRRSEPIELADDPESEVALVVDESAPEDRIAGRVLREDGSPAPRVTLDVKGPTRGASWAGSVPVASDGSFCFLSLARGPHLLMAVDESTRTVALAREVTSGSLDVRLRLHRIASAFVEVVDTEGRPVETFAVETRAESFGFAEREERHTGGRAELTVPPLPFRLFVKAKGFDERTLGPFEPDTVPPVIPCALARSAGVFGRVLDGEAPVSGAKVWLEKRIEPGHCLRAEGFLLDRTPETHPEAVTTRDDGLFRLAFPKRGTYFVRAEAAGLARAEVGPLSLGRESAEVDVPVSRGGALEGRVLVADGREAAGLIVAISRGDGHPQWTRTDANGDYRFERLTPGGYQVEDRDEPVEASGAWGSSGSALGPGETDPPLPCSCQVQEGATTRFDLDMRSGAGLTTCRLEGRFTVAGRPAREWHALLFERPPLRGAGSESISLD
ncbi:MAG TPA: carboxypeptidase-like regulatory domain-containing protein, partial [Planctomycetota bacterium]|nr:carboxypeptidase-like regulatory domain-containing protein [Planctomycetota bacterium]